MLSYLAGGLARRVADAVACYLTETNANHGGPFATSVESDRLLDAAHQAVADFLGASDPDCVYFGPNMTTLTFALSRALSRTWSAGDEVLVTHLDHDANVTPWLLAGRLLEGLARRTDIRVWGITEPNRLRERVPTVSFTHERHSPREMAERLAGQGIFVWPGNHYALPLTEAMHLEPAGTLRVGLLHYNTAAEVDRLLVALEDFV